MATLLMAGCGGDPPAPRAEAPAPVAAKPIPVLPQARTAVRTAPAGAILIPALAATTAWVPRTGNERVTGSMPKGWQDDTGWCKTWVEYGPGVEDGRPFWRTTVSRSEGGRAQICHPLPDLAEEGVFRLTARLRSTGLEGVEFGLRQRGAPWEWVWNQQPGITGGWQEFTWIFRLDRHDRSVGFYFGLNGLGRLDVADLRLERWPLAQYLAATAAPPGDGPKNLLRITRAPLGVPTGWTIDRDDSDGDVVTAAGDPAVPGPSGAAALHLRTSKPESALWCSALTIPAGARHVASLWLKGQGTGRLLVQGDGRQVGESRFAVAPGDGWKRVEIAFEPVVLAQVHALKLVFTGDLWLDALQVERGDKATAWSAPQACEVALQHASPGRLQFTPEVEVAFAVSGATAGAVLMSEAIDIYGRRARLPDQPLATGRGTLRCAALADRPYGPLRIEATAVSADGRALSEPSEIVVVRLPQPRHWGEDAPDSFFGVHTNSTTRHNLMAKAMGANWVRGHDAGQYTTWHQLEPEQGVWKFRDADIQRYRANHLKMLGMLSTAPRWASTVGANHTGYFDQYYQPKDLAAWQTYVRTVTARYRGVIDTYELWNEPWGDAFWHLGGNYSKWESGPDPAGDYARLSKLAYAAAKETDPGLTILGFNTADGRADWTRRVAAAGGLDACDVVSYHQYEGNPGGSADDRMAKGWKDAIGPVFGADGQPPKPVWLSEGGPFWSVSDSGFYRLSHPGAESGDLFTPGDRCARFLISVMARGVRRAFIYSMHCHTYFWPKGGCQALVTADGYLHPSASAYAACAWHLEDTKPAGIADAAKGVAAFAFQGRDRAVVVLAPQAGHVPYVLPAGCAAADLYGNPLPAGTVLGSTVVYLSAPGTAATLLTTAGAR